jgi:tRNA pseudouridine55 synthase
VTAAAPEGRPARRPAAPDGLLLVDKPAGWTSHDVVGRLRGLCRTRRVGHAGTLDPAATGLLVCGIGRATRLLTHLVGADKTYVGTIRLGQATLTDDAEGEPLGPPDPDVAAKAFPAAVAAAVAGLTGPLQQVPSAVSAVKINGVRSYARVRAGETVELPPRPVTVARFEVLGRREPPGFVDLDVAVDCSSGTYIRALARDLGVALGTAGHLTALRRTRVGMFELARAVSLEQLAAGDGAVDGAVVPLATAVRDAFGARVLDEADARAVRHGRSLPAAGHPGIVGAFDAEGAVLALLAEADGRAAPRVVFAPA